MDMDQLGKLFGVLADISELVGRTLDRVEQHRDDSGVVADLLYWAEGAKVRLKNGLDDSPE